MNEAMGFDVYNLLPTNSVTMTLTAKASDCHHVPCVMVFDSHDLSVGEVSNAILSGGSDKPRVPVVCINSSGDDISGTLDANYFKGQGQRQGVEREFVVICDGCE